MPKTKTQKLTAEKLAALVLQVLDTQQEYYRTKRTELLHECKRMEKNLRARARETLFSPPEERPGLFGDLPDEA
jgi:hypothetical protein